MKQSGWVPNGCCRMMKRDLGLGDETAPVGIHFHVPGRP